VYVERGEYLHCSLLSEADAMALTEGGKDGGEADDGNVNPTPVIYHTKVIK